MAFHSLSGFFFPAVSVLVRFLAVIVKNKLCSQELGWRSFARIWSSAWWEFLARKPKTVLGEKKKTDKIIIKKNLACLGGIDGTSK